MTVAPNPRPPESAPSARALTIAIVGAVLACAAAGVALLQESEPAPQSRVLDARASPRGSGAGRLLPKLSAPARGNGPHTLSGQVVDVSGAPVAGAVISADFRLGPGVRGKPAKDEGSGLVLTPEVAARSQADGGFSLEGLLPGRYRLHISGAGVFPAEVRFVKVPGDAMRLVVSRKVEVGGRVVAGIQPAAGADVFIAGPTLNAPIEAVTDKRGQFAARDVPAGTFEVWALNEARNLASPAVQAARLGPGPFDPLVLSMVPAHRIGGRVVDGQGRGIAGATVIVRDAEGSEPARQAMTGEDGQFEVAGLLPGQWIAEAHASGYVSGEQVLFAADRGEPLLLTAFQGGQISGLVVGPDGAPVKGAVIAAYLQTPGGGHREVSAVVQARQGKAGGERFLPRGELGVLLGPIPFPPPPGAAAVRVATPVWDEASGAAASADTTSAFVTDAGGRFVVAGLSPGSYRVVAHAADFAAGRSRALEVKLGETERDVRIVLPRGVRVEGEIKDGAGNPIPGAIVEWKPATPRLGAAPVAAVADDRGHYVIGPLTGRVVLTASAYGYGRASRQVGLRGGEEAPAVIEQDFVLAGSHGRIFGQVLDPGGFPLAGARVLAEGKNGAKGTAVTGEHGRFAIAGVPEGGYALRIVHPDYPPARARAESGVAADLVMKFGGGIRGEVRAAQSGEPIAGAKIVLSGPGKTSRQAITDDAGEFGVFPLAVGRWTVMADAPGFAPAKTSAEVEAGNRARKFTVDDLRLELVRGATLAGTVRDGWGELVSGAVVSSGGVRAKTDADGHFRLEDVPAGDITLVIEHKKVRGTEAISVLPGDEVVTLDLRLPRPE